MTRSMLSSMLVLFAMVASLHAENPKMDREAGPAPFLKIWQKDARSIETHYTTTHMVYEQRIEVVTAPDGSRKEVPRKAEIPVIETRSRATGINSIEAFMADGAIVEGKQLTDRLAHADAVAVYWLSQEPDSDYLKLLKSGTLVVCIPDSLPIERRPLLAVSPRSDGGPQPESPRPAGSPPPAPEHYVRGPVQPPRDEAVYAKIGAGGQLDLRRPPAKTVATNKDAPVHVHMSRIPLETVRAFDVRKNPIDKDQLKTRLATETLVLVAHGRDPVDPYYSQIMKPDTLILAIDAKSLYPRRAP